MWTILKNRFRQGYRTSAFPKGRVELPERFRGRPVLDPAKCGANCAACAEVCPTGAIEVNPLRLDLGKCLFCPACREACPSGGIEFTRDHRLAVSHRKDLRIDAISGPRVVKSSAEIRRLFGRSLKLRQVSAGGCNSCESDLAVLQTVVFDLGRFGIQFVASPRHADGMVITGPVTANMRRALRETYDAVPSPKLVVALGSCALSGGPFAGGDASGTGVPDDIPVVLFIPGCPPHPYTILDALISFLQTKP
jgi:Ni,Fe-hydrogenase III small subunit/Pyruvate/2-oxoacid:ferredoxin oxidoreductase delta subunit